MESPSRPCSHCGSIYVADSCCALHCGDGSSAGTTAPFDDHTLDKCSKVLSIRKAKNLKYKEVVLPEMLTKKLDIMLNAIGNLLPWEEIHCQNVTMLNQNQYIQDQKVLWQVVHHQQE